MNKLASTIAVALLSATFAALAAPGSATPAEAGAIYEWIDDGGRLQASDTVPEKYKRVAKRVDPNRSRIPAAEQVEAEQQAATLKAKAASVSPQLRPAGSGARTGGGPTAGPSATRSLADSPKCVAWRRQVAASRECFVYTSKPNGHQRFSSCSNEPDPEPECGPDAPR